MHLQLYEPLKITSFLIVLIPKHANRYEKKIGIGVTAVNVAMALAPSLTSHIKGCSYTEGEEVPALCSIPSFMCLPVKHVYH